MTWLIICIYFFFFLLFSLIIHNQQQQQERTDLLCSFVHRLAQCKAHRLLFKKKKMQNGNDRKIVYNHKQNGMKQKKGLVMYILKDELRW